MAKYKNISEIEQGLSLPGLEFTLVKPGEIVEIPDNYKINFPSFKKVKLVPKEEVKKPEIEEKKESPRKGRPKKK